LRGEGALKGYRCPTPKAGQAYELLGFIRIESLAFSATGLVFADVQEVYVSVAAGFTFLFFSQHVTSLEKKGGRVIALTLTLAAD